jgi:putative transposase
MASRGRRAAQGAVRGDNVGPNPTDRAKNGVKVSLLVEGAGGPLAAVVDGANRHDTKLLDATLAAVVVERPQRTPEEPQNLCLDKGYDHPTGWATVAKHGYVPHIRRIGEEKFDPATAEKKYPARRRVVERTIAWLSHCRTILIRYDVHSENYRGLIQLAAALLWFRRLTRLQVLR